MSDFSRPLRAPWSPKPGSHEAKVIDFMFTSGHPGYSGHIADLHDDFYLIQGEAGEGHGFCEFTQRSLDKIDAELERVVQEAVDRYDDWASDPLP